MDQRSARRVMAPAALLLTTAFVLSGCVNVGACTTIGYLFDGPAIIQFADALPRNAEIAACFGEECQPASVVDETEQGWVVPQEAPYFPQGAFGDGGIRQLRVVVTRGGETVADQVHEIPVTVERTGLFGQCLGPFSFEPVVVDLES